MSAKSRFFFLVGGLVSLGAFEGAVFQLPPALIPVFRHKNAWDFVVVVVFVEGMVS